MLKLSYRWRLPEMNSSWCPTAWVLSWLLCILAKVARTKKPGLFLNEKVLWDWRKVSHWNNLHCRCCCQHLSQLAALKQTVKSQKDKYFAKQPYIYSHRQTDVWTDGQTNKQLDRLNYRQRDRQTTGRQIDRQKERKTVRQDGQTYDRHSY
jgi:hypothetical protein